MLPSDLHAKVSALLGAWKTSGLPARTTLHGIADGLLQWRSENHVPGLWQNPPLMLGATVDDAWGMGIDLILKYARVLGMETDFLGTLLSWPEIAAACQEIHPDYLGLTVLQLDSEEDLIAIRAQIPAKVKIIAGGPAFTVDAMLQQRARIEFVARDLSAFLHYFIQSQP